MDQDESPEPKFYAYAKMRAWKIPIVCCQPDWDKGEIWATKLCVHTIAKLGRVMQKFCRRMIFNWLNLFITYISS